MLFVRWPQPGFTKTRLAADWSGEAAAGLYRAMAEMVRDTLRPGAGKLFELCYYATPRAREEDLRDWLMAGQPDNPAERLVFQPESAGLAERLAFGGEIAVEAPAVFFIGTDMIDLSLEEFAAALEKGGPGKAVIGGAEDGGFWLLGLESCPAGLFEGIEYSTERTLVQLLARLKEFRLEPVFVSRKRDVDTVEDLRVQNPKVLQELAERARHHGVRVIEVLRKRC